MMEVFLFLLVTVAVSWDVSLQVVPIDNGIAPPEIVHRVLAQNYTPHCKVVGKPLDLLFVLDSSGSLKNKFQDELDVIREIVNIVAIGAQSTRVALVQFSGVQRTEFHFNTFFRRRNVLQAVDTLRHVSGITQTGAAFRYATQELTKTQGMRGREVPKIVSLLSDGRTHDHPLDKIWAQKIRELVPGLVFWAYGTGDYVAMTELINITRDETKIVTNKNLHRVAEMFDQYRGTEVCEDMPVCIPGSDKPLDLLFVVDGSNSIEGRFNEELNVVRQLLNNVNVHPLAVQVALITYSERPHRHFDFKRYRSRDQILDHLITLRPVNRTTQTKRALRMAFNTFTVKYGMRNATVQKMAVVLTDGYSMSSPTAFARRLVRLKNVTVVAIAVSPEMGVDARELLEITDRHRQLVFTRSNLHSLQDWFLQHVSYSCPGLDVSQHDIEPYVRGPTEIKCTTNAVIFKVRTRNPFSGFLYVHDRFGEPGCLVRGDGSTEASITIVDGQCGVKKRALNTPLKRGYVYNTTMVVQFHPEVVTKVDQALSVDCFVPAPVSVDVNAETLYETVQITDCRYTIRKGHEGCVALDGSIGQTVNHQWECKLPKSSYGMLVHNCIAESDVKSMEILDRNGCHLKSHIMDTPKYGMPGFASSDMIIFQFPGASTLKFRCLISLCDYDQSAVCKQQISPLPQVRGFDRQFSWWAGGLRSRYRSTSDLREPLTRSASPPLNWRSKPLTCSIVDLNLSHDLGAPLECGNQVPKTWYSSNEDLTNPKTRPEFVATFPVETRRLNILETDNLKPTTDILQYCKDPSSF